MTNWQESLRKLHILKAWTNSQECSRKLLYLGELNFPLHQSSMYLQVSKWPPDLLICSMPHCVTKFTRNWTMNLTYSWPTNKIPARIPYHFHVEANKRFVHWYTWVQSMHNKMYSYNAKFNQNWNSCCIPEFRFPGRSFHIKLFHLRICFTKLGWEMTLICSTHTVQNSTHNLVEQFLAQPANSYSCWYGTREETKGPNLSNSEHINLIEVCPVQHTAQVILVTLGWLELHYLITHKKFQKKTKIIQEIRNMLANQISYVKSILNDCQFLTAWRT